MTKEQQRIAIAEACGWKNLEIEDFSEYGVPCFMLMGSNHTGTRLMPPDYLNDLNAMHEAEKTLNQNLAAEYARILTSIAWQSEQPTFAPMTATAAQRAEAFLRTINKWEETKL